MSDAEVEIATTFKKRKLTIRGGRKRKTSSSEGNYDKYKLNLCLH